MKISMTRICVLAAAPLLAAGAARATDLSGTISTTKTITTNSKLTGNVTCTVASAPCIKFGAGGIKLDLKGFTITGRGKRDKCTAITSGEDGIDTNGKNAVSIEGPGIVRRFNGNGIKVGGNDSKVDDVTVLSSCLEGILVRGSRNQITENSVVRSARQGGFVGGIFLPGPGGSNYIRNNEVIGGPGAAAADGIFVGNGFPSKNNVIEGNSTSGTTDVGIRIQGGSTGNQVRRNQALGNDGPDILDANAPGVNIYTDNLCEVSIVGPGAGKNICKVPHISGHREPD